MRGLVTLILIVGSSVAITDNMTAVPKDKGYCKGKEHIASCNEWFLIADNSIRIVDWSQDEDYSFTKIFRKDKKGRYVQVAEVVPTFQDSTRPGLFYGIPDKADIVLSRAGKVVAVRGTYKRSAVSDSDRESLLVGLDPTIQHSAVSNSDRESTLDGLDQTIHTFGIPFVLFTGTTAHLRDTIRGEEWRFITLDELAVNDNKRIEEQIRKADQELRNAKEALKKH